MCKFRNLDTLSRSDAERERAQTGAQKEPIAAGAELTLKLTDVELLVGNLYCARPNESRDH
jgi:hypothetical protein